MNAAIERRDYGTAVALLRERLAANSADEPARFTLARVLGWSGDYAAALAEYDALLARSPANADYALGRAQVLGWSGRDADALAELARARALAPDYEDIWRLDLALRARRDGAGTELEALRADAARRFPDAEWWRKVETPPPRAARTEVTAGTTRESLSRDVPDWRSMFVQVTHRRDAERNVHAAFSRDERFGASDSQLSGGADWRLAERWTAGVEIGFGGDARFLPEVAASGWALRALPQGWEAEMRVRHRAYSEAKATSGGGGIAKYFGNFRAGYGVDVVRLHGDATSAAHAATLAYYPSERTRFSATLVAGEEAEAVGPERVLRTDVRSVNAGGRHALGGRWSVSWWVGTHRQGDLFRRRHVGASVTAGF